MSILSRIFGTGAAKSLENPKTPITTETLSGAEAVENVITVDYNTVLSIPEFWRAVEIKAGIIASLPFSIVKQTDEGLEHLKKHSITKLIAVNPSELYSSYNFRQTMVMHLELYGNFYAWIRRRRATGEVWSLQILNPEDVTIDVKDGRSKRYIVEDENGKRTFFSDQIFHLHKPGVSGHAGSDLINVHKKNYVLALAHRDYLANFNANGTFLSGVLKHPGELKPAAAKRLRSSWRTAYSSASKAGRVAVLEEGMEFQKISSNPTEAGSDSTQKLITASISRITGVPKILLEDYANATLNNAEHIAQHFLSYTIRPFAEMVESEIHRKLLSDEDQEEHQAVFDMKGLLRPDAKGRASYMDTLMKYGVINRDEARKMEGYNPIEDGSGKDYLVPLNMFDPNKPEDGND